MTYSARIIFKGHSYVSEKRHIDGRKILVYSLAPSPYNEYEGFVAHFDKQHAPYCFAETEQAAINLLLEL